MSSSPVVLGLDFGGTKISIATCDPSGAQLASATIATTAADGAEAVMARAVAAAKQLLTRMPDTHLLAVGAATLGIPFEDRVELAPTIPGWEALPFGRRLRTEFSYVPVRVVTDVKAAAEAERRWGALVGADPGIYLNLGTGLASAIVVGGMVVRGAHHASGELGYSLRDTADVGVPLTHRITLEDVVSGKSLGTAATAKFGRVVSAAEVFQLALTDGAARALVDAFLEELALHLVNLAVAIDPQRIAVGGGLVRSWSSIGPALRTAVDAAVPYPPELVVAKFPFDAPLIGALALGVEAADARRADEVSA